jgi:hypothetical protein
MILQKKIDIVLYSNALRKLLKKRFAELKLIPMDVVRDAHSEGMTSITKEKLSRYLNSSIPVHGFPTQIDVLWLASRYNINFVFKVTYMPLNDAEGKANAKKLLESTKIG